jgi:hypothetical protein
METHSSFKLSYKINFEWHNNIHSTLLISQSTYNDILVKYIATHFIYYIGLVHFTLFKKSGKEIYSNN